MSKRIVLTLLVLIILCALGFFLIFDVGRRSPDDTVSPVATTTQSSEDTSPATTTQSAADVMISSPQALSVIKSPIHVTGQARGTWFFEGSLPIKIFDAHGAEIGRGSATAQGEWMTTDYVSFDASITFSSSTTKTGKIVISKDNPSGDPERDQSMELPIIFSK